MTLLSSDSTFETFPQPVRVEYGNLFDDSKYHRGVRLQADRLDDIAGFFGAPKPSTLPYVAGWSEGANPDNLYRLAEKCGLVLATEPQQYSPREWMGLAVTPTTPIVREPEFIRYGREREGFRPGIFTVNIAGVEVVIIHPPHYIFSGIKDRYECTELALDILPEKAPAVVAGDTNSLIFQRPRMKFARAKFEEIYDMEGLKPPLYPTKSYRGLEWPRIVRMHLDTMMIRNLRLLSHQEAETDGSDHPFISADVQPLTQSKSGTQLYLVQPALKSLAVKP